MDTYINNELAEVAYQKLTDLENEAHTVLETNKGWASIAYRVLNNRQGRYFDKNVYFDARQKLMQLIRDKGANISEIALYHYFASQQSYFQTLQGFDDLRSMSIDRNVKTRLLSIPMYTSLLEGTLSNLYRAILRIIDSTSSKDYASQNTLKPMVDVLCANGFGSCTGLVNSSFRNAINHGGVYTTDNGNELVFTYRNDNAEVRESITPYEFEKQIFSILDMTSALVIALAVTIGDHFDESVNIEYKPTRLALLGIKLSDKSCYYRDCFDVEQKKQLNLVFEISVTEEGFLLEKAGELAFKAYSNDSDYASYCILFKHPRLASNFIRIKNEDIRAFIEKGGTFLDLVKTARENDDFLWYPISDENIDLQEAQFYRFPNYESKNFSIYDVEDISSFDRKRIKACVYVGGIQEKAAILDITAFVTEWLKCLYNPPSATLSIKHGSMEADLVYFKVFHEDTRGNKGLYKDNENFVCTVEWCSNDKYRLGESPLTPHLTQNKEVIGEIIIRWRSRDYFSTIKRVDIGRNDLCPCGSGKKYKKCCGQLRISC